MIDGIHWVKCSRPGCGKDVGARRYQDNKVIEEEFYPGIVKEDGSYYCKACFPYRNIFMSPEDFVC